MLNIFYSCQKNNQAVSPASLTGQWNWIQTYPGGNPASYPHFPLTPQNTQRWEILVFNTNRQFTRTTNDTLSVAGTYTTGHGIYLPYTGASRYDYDSICYFVNGTKTGIDYYKILNDTLVLSGAFSGAIGVGSIYYIRN